MADGVYPSNSTGLRQDHRPLNNHHIGPEVIPGRRDARSGTTSSSEDSEHVIGKKPQRSSDDNSHLTASRALSSRATERQSAYLEHPHEHGVVRSLPPWIDSFEDNNPGNSGTTDRLLASPERIHSAEHHYAAKKPGSRVSEDGFVDDFEDYSRRVLPTKQPERRLFFRHSKAPVRGRKWDHLREGEPIIVRSAYSQPASPWKAFVQSSMYGPSLEEDGEIVDQSILEKQNPGFSKPWIGDLHADDPEKAIGLFHGRKRRRVWYQRVQHLLLTHPLVPLAFRLTVLTTSAIALGLSGSIYNRTRSSNFPQTPSTVMAIVVDTVAIPYIGYVTWDEYTGAPLGLRSAKAKMRLVLLDLFFIMFESANLALAFATLRDETGTCENGVNGTSPSICGRVKTLSAFLFIALLAWGLTFTVSIFRVVERVGGRESSE